MHVVMRLTLLREGVRARGPASVECTESAKRIDSNTEPNSCDQCGSAIGEWELKLPKVYLLVNQSRAARVSDANLIQPRHPWLVERPGANFQRIGWLGTPKGFLSKVIYLCRDTQR
jgi:hypothetical protein